MCHFSFVSSLCIYIIYACARLFFFRPFSLSPSLRLTLLLWFSFALEYIYFFVCNLLRSSVCSGCFPFTSSIAHITSSFYLYFRYTQFYFLSLFEFTLILCLCRSYFPPFISFVCFKWEEEQQRKKNESLSFSTHGFFSLIFPINFFCSCCYSPLFLGFHFSFQHLAALPLGTRIKTASIWLWMSVCVWLFYTHIYLMDVFDVDVTVVVTRYKQ